MVTSQQSAIQTQKQKKHLHQVLLLPKKKDADLVLATDPDADRLGVYVKDAKSGEIYSFNR